MCGALLFLSIPQEADLYSQLILLVCHLFLFLPFLCGNDSKLRCA